MAQKNIKATCNSVNKQVNRTQIRFNIPARKGNGNAGNVSINLQEGGLAIADEVEQGKDYKITITED